MEQEESLLEKHEIELLNLKQNQQEVVKLLKEKDVNSKRLARLVKRLYDSNITMGEITRDGFVELQEQLIELGVLSEVIGSVENFEAFCHVTIELIEFIEGLENVEVPEAIKESMESAREFANAALESLENEDEEDEEEESEEDESPEVPEVPSET